MKVLHVSSFDDGGAARAALRLHDGLLRQGIESHFVAIKPEARQAAVSTPLNKRQIAAAYAKRYLAAKILSLQVTPTNEVIHSLGIFSSGLGKWIESSDFDIVNLHWICAEALSIKEIGCLSKPIVWTMHDMWSFAGAEHYDDLDNPGRWRLPYTPASRPSTYRGPDIDRYVWKRKARLWQGKRFHLVSPSHWLARCARESALMGSQPCQVIHNPIDTEVFAPVDRGEARRMLGLPLDKKLVLFGALDATTDKRKGYDLLLTALRCLQKDCTLGNEIEIIVFGGGKGGDLPNVAMKGHFLGSFKDDLSLRVVYSAADVFIAPSRQDNLPNTVVEAGACGLPTVAFDIGGMSDIIIDNVTGILAAPFDANALARAIQGLLQSPIDRVAIRRATQAKFSLEVNVPKYVSLYRNLLTPS